VRGRADQRLLISLVGEQAQYRQANPQPVRRGPVPLPQRNRKCIALGTGQLVKPGKHRREQLVERGEWQLHFRLNTADLGNPEVVRLAGRVVQQRCLADARLAAQHEHAAAARPALSSSSCSAAHSRHRPRRSESAYVLVTLMVRRPLARIIPEQTSLGRSAREV
jgi:hypothetical protein